MSLYSYVSRTSNPRTFAPAYEQKSSKNIDKLSRSPSPIRQNDSGNFPAMILNQTEVGYKELPMTYKGGAFLKNGGQERMVNAGAMMNNEGVTFQKVVSENVQYKPRFSDVAAAPQKLIDSRSEFATQTDTSLLDPAPQNHNPHGPAPVMTSSSKRLNYTIQPRVSADPYQQNVVSTRESVRSSRLKPSIFGPSNLHDSAVTQPVTPSGPPRDFYKANGPMSDHIPRQSVDNMSIDSKFGGSIIGSQSGDFQNNYIVIKDDHGQRLSANQYPKQSQFKETYPRLYNDLNNSKTSKASTFQEALNYHCFQPKSKPQAPKYDIFKPMELDSRKPSMLKNGPARPSEIDIVEPSRLPQPASNAVENAQSFPPTPQNEPAARNSKIDEIKNFVEELKNRLSKNQVSERIDTVAQMINENRNELRRIQSKSPSVNAIQETMNEIQMKHLDAQLKMRYADEAYIKQMRRSASVETVRTPEYKPIVALLPPVVRLSAKREASIDRFSVTNGQMVNRVSTQSRDNKTYSNHSEKNSLARAGVQNAVHVQAAPQPLYHPSVVTNQYVHHTSVMAPQQPIRLYSQAPPAAGVTTYNQTHHFNISNSSHGSKTGSSFFDVPALIPQAPARPVMAEQRVSRPVPATFGRDNFFDI